MTMLPLNMDAALDMLGTPGGVNVYERTGTRDDNGTWNAGAKGPTRNIAATVVQADPNTLQILAPGEVTGGGIVLHTKETLYFPTKTLTGVENRQSFVEYMNLTFRVIGAGFQTPMAAFNTYTAVRYVDYGIYDNTQP